MQLYTSYDEGRLTIYLQGELDNHGARQVGRNVDKLLDEYMPRDCALDLSALSFMDSSGIALILKVYRRMRDMGGRAWIENARSQPLKVIDASGIERLIKIRTAKEV